MDFNLHTSFLIEDRSYLSVVKGEIKRISEEIGLSPEELGKLNIVATELFTNLIKFGEKDREILVRPVLKNKYPGIEIISLDKGPGAPNIQRMMEDGYSTSGTQGEGLGAVRRMSDEFDIYSYPNQGTLVLSRIFRKKINIYDKPRERFEVGSVMVAKRGELVCGDQWFVEEKDNMVSIIVLDGLGHGPEANKAACIAVDTFREKFQFAAPDEILAQVHESLKRTRGAVGLVVKADLARKTLMHCGVGNISCRIINPVNYENNKSLILFNGILGLNVKRMNSNAAAWDNGKVLIIHSDGLNTRWDLNNYPGIIHHHPTLMAAILYRDHVRKTDDVTVVVGRNKK